MEKTKQTQEQLQNIEETFCDFCKEEKATLTIDTPKNKDVPSCDLCFKRLNVIAGVMKKSSIGMTTKEIFEKVENVTDNNFLEFIEKKEVRNSSQT